MVKKALVIGAAALVTGGIAVAAAAGPVGRSQIEEPEYEVLERFEKLELRRYEPRLVAEVVIEAEDGQQAARAGFRHLGNYIFGANEVGGEIAMTAPVEQRATSAKIEMTAPVEQRETETPGRFTVRFTMPRKWTMETIPKPTDKKVRLVEAPAACMFVKRFSGSPSPDKVARKASEVEAAAVEAGLTVLGTHTYARYDPPWVPGPFRRNEILFPVQCP